MFPQLSGAFSPQRTDRTGSARDVPDVFLDATGGRRITASLTRPLPRSEWPWSLWVTVPIMRGGVTDENPTATPVAQQFCPYCGSWLASGEPHRPECTSPDGPQHFCPDCGYRDPGLDHDFGCGDMYVN